MSNIDLIIKLLKSISGANNFIRTINHLISTFKAELRDAKHLKAQRTQHLVRDITTHFLRKRRFYFILIYRRNKYLDCNGDVVKPDLLSLLLTYF
jgi:hypothetical protein